MSQQHAKAENKKPDETISERFSLIGKRRTCSESEARNTVPPFLYMSQQHAITENQNANEPGKGGHTPGGGKSGNPQKAFPLG
jgi:hypothetical protein